MVGEGKIETNFDRFFFHGNYYPKELTTYFQQTLFSHHLDFDRSHQTQVSKGVFHVDCGLDFPSPSQQAKDSQHTTTNGSAKDWHSGLRRKTALCLRG